MSPSTGRREELAGVSGLPCNPPPCHTLVAVGLDTGEKRWEVPFGQVPIMVAADTLDTQALGSPAIGGQIVSAGDLVFIGTAADDCLRTYDIGTRNELWRGAARKGVERPRDLHARSPAVRRDRGWRPCLPRREQGCRHRHLRAA